MKLNMFSPELMVRIELEMRSQGFNPRKGFQINQDRLLARRIDRSIGELTFSKDVWLEILREAQEDIQLLTSFDKEGSEDAVH